MLVGFAVLCSGIFEFELNCILDIKASQYTIASTLLESIVKRISQLKYVTPKGGVYLLPKDGHVDPSLLNFIVAAQPSAGSQAEFLTLVYALNNILLTLKRPEGVFAWLAEGKVRLLSLRSFINTGWCSIC